MSSIKLLSSTSLVKKFYIQMYFSLFEFNLLSFYAYFKGFYWMSKIYNWGKFDFDKAFMFVNWLLYKTRNYKHGALMKVTA